MTPEKMLEDLKRDHQRYIKILGEVRKEVRREFKHAMDKEIASRMEHIETPLFTKAVEARRAGVKRQELSNALSATTSERFDRIMRIGGWFDDVEEGF